VAHTFHTIFKIFDSAGHVISEPDLGRLKGLIKGYQIERGEEHSSPLLY
jgi:hypothetical protein